MAFTIRRWCTMSSDTVWAACLKAASTLAASPKRLKHHVAGCAFPDLRCAGLQGILDLADRRQGIVRDLDQLGGVLRLGAALGHHGGHRLADIAHGLVRQRTARRHLGLPPSALGNIAGREGVTDSIMAMSSQVKTATTPAALLRSRRVDPDDPGMGVRRAHQHEGAPVGPGRSCR
mgnify:CR=1 FL=1